MSLEFDPMIRSLAKTYASFGKSVNNSTTPLYEDLVQEGHLAVLEALGAIKTRDEKPSPLKSYLRKCVHHHFRKFMKARSFDVGMLSLDEEIGKDEAGDPITRLDLIGVDATQEESTLASEKRRVQTLVASNRIEAMKKEGASKKGNGNSRIDEIVRMRTKGLTYKQIGDHFGISLQAVAKSLSKLKKRTAG